MRQATTQGLYQYWNTVRGGRLAPRRYEIEPSQIAAHLSETMILENPSDNCRIRVAGTQICDWLGQDLRGEPFFEQWSADDQNVLRDGLAAISQYGAVGVYTFNGELVADASPAQFEMLLLPLTHLESRIERILGSIALVAGPAWLEASGPSRLRLTSNALVWPDGRPRGAQRSAQIFPFNDDEVPVVRSQTGVRRARLVRSDRRSFLVYDGGRASDVDQDGI